MSLRRLLAPLLALLVVSALVFGLVSGLIGALARDGLETLGLQSNPAAHALDPNVPGAGGSSVAAGPGSDVPGRSLPATPIRLAPVLPPASAGPVPVAAEVAARVRAVHPDDIGSYSGAVVDADSGTVVFAHRANHPSIPASTLKLLTCAAALSALGPEHRFQTTVVSPEAGRIILVGGGDPYLEAPGQADPPSARGEPRASLAALARSTSDQLKRDGVGTVSLGYDASRFSGPSWNPTWPQAYGDQVSPVSALWVNEGRRTPGGGVVGSRVDDPAKVAAQTFAKALGRRGIDVTGVTKARAPRGARPVASVPSMTLDRIVQHVLMNSDNDGAEVLLRQTALADGRPGSFTGGVAAVQARLSKLGAWGAGMSLRDGSGLSRRDAVSADALVTVLRTAARPQHLELRPLLTALPVAGVEGSLTTRFDDPDSTAGRGVVRGKTGTLRKVRALAGTMRTRDGSLLVYAFVVNDAKNDDHATVWLQRVTSALSACGCR